MNVSGEVAEGNARNELYALADGYRTCQKCLYSGNLCKHQLIYPIKSTCLCERAPTLIRSA